MNSGGGRRPLSAYVLCSLQCPSHRQQEAATLQRALAKEIPEDNKGFQLLAKMGFKKGMGLGSDSSGITAPLPVKLKSGAYYSVSRDLVVLDRSGLGKEEEEARKEEEKVTSALRAEKTSLSTFKARVANKFQEKRQEEQYKKVELDPSARPFSHCLFFSAQALLINSIVATGCRMDPTLLHRLLRRRTRSSRRLLSLHRCEPSLLS